MFTALKLFFRKLSRLSVGIGKGVLSLDRKLINASRSAFEISSVSTSSRPDCDGV
jgi:hypothetical protein